jgi:drug/metabolite transporter (DMT)-like permease
MSGLSVPRRVALSLILAAASWGVGTAISKRAVLEFPPLTLLPIQLAVSLVSLVLIMRWRGEHLRAGSVPALLGRLGLLNPGLAYALSLLGLVQITASLSVLLWAVEPLMILVLAALFLSERVGRGVVLLSAIAIAGMTLVLWSPGGGGHVLGVLLTLAGVGSCAVYSVVTRRWLSTAGSTIQVVVVQQAYALVFAVLVLVGVALLGGRVWPTSLSVEGALSVAASGLVYYGLAYSFYLYGLRHVPASIAAVSFYLIPVFGIAAGSLLGERFDGRQWIGAVVVIVAVSMVAWRTSIAVTEASVTNSS